MDDIKIMFVVSKKPNNFFIGFLSAEEIKAKEYDLKFVFVENLIPMNKKDAEKDSAYKQPIAYMIIRGLNSGKVFFYRRSKKAENHGEKRLLGQMSGCIGGHVEIFDVGEHDDNPILRSATRELCEEIGIVTTEKDLKFVGVVNDNSDSVGEVHLGLVYSVIVDINLVKISSPEIAEGGFVSPDFIKKKCKLSGEVENWTRILAENKVF